MVGKDLSGNEGPASGLQPLCIILKPTEAGGYISKHLKAVRNIVAGADREIDFDLARVNGECHIPLPLHYCAIRAQALVNQINALTDGRGRPLLESEISSQPLGWKK